MNRAAVVACVALGAALGALGQAALTRQAPREAVPTAIRGEPPARVACTASLAPSDLAALRADLAAVIDERLGDASHGLPAPERPAAPQRPAEPPAEAVAAAATASQVFDAALTQGTWKDADRAGFRAALVAMTDAQRSAAMSRLLTALNEGQLRSEVVGPVL